MGLALIVLGVVMQFVGVALLAHGYKEDARNDCIIGLIFLIGAPFAFYAAAGW